MFESKTKINTPEATGDYNKNKPGIEISDVKSKSTLRHTL